jgi:hypothetical protein
MKKFFKKMGPPTKDPSNVNPGYLKYKSWHINYYKNNSEKIKQKQKDRRLAFNKTRPSLNLICTYCNKPFILPGMKENGHKQKPVKHCSYLCHKREERFRKLWIPKWLYNYYLDKKLFRVIAAFKGRGFRNIFKLRSRYLFGKNRSLWEILTLVDIWSLYHPSNYLRKKWPLLDKLIKKFQEKKRKWKWKKYTKTPRFKSTQRSWMKRQPKDSNFKIAAKFRSTVAGALKKRKGVFKHTRTQILLGTDFKTARAYIENLFESGMTWENHGMGHGKWNLDHKQPCASFDLKCPVQQLACFNYKNLQPLWAIDNMKKGAKLNYEFKPSRY